MKENGKNGRAGRLPEFIPLTHLPLIDGQRKETAPMEEKALVYGMRLYDRGAMAAVEPARVTLQDGGPSTVTMHLMEGTREQIKRQLLASIDAFFELHE